MRERIQKIILNALTDLNEESENKNLGNPSLETKLYGSEGALDSLALVSLISELEERISDEFDKEIVLADERAMSRKRSPFRTAGSLGEYIEELLSE